MESIYQTNEPTGLEVVSRRFQTQPEWRQLWVGSWRRAITASSHPALMPTSLCCSFSRCRRNMKKFLVRPTISAIEPDFATWKCGRLRHSKWMLAAVFQKTAHLAACLPSSAQTLGFYLYYACGYVELFIQLRFGVGLCPLWHHKGHSTYTSYCYKYIINVTSEKYGTYDD